MDTIVIPYKRLDVPVSWAQIRRVRCTACPATFSWVAAGWMRLSVFGVPVVHDDETMRRWIAKAAGVKLKAIARRAAPGMARCPACGSLQKGMLAGEIRRAGGVTALTAFIASPFVGMAFTEFIEPASRAIWTGVAVTAVAAVAFLAAWVRVRARSATAPDPRSMREAEFRAFLAECAAAGLDPALTWHATRVRCREPRQGTVPMSLGIDDRVGGIDLPPGTSAESALQVIDALVHGLEDEQRRQAVDGLVHTLAGPDVAARMDAHSRLVGLTGRRFPPDAEAWEAWWTEHRATWTGRDDGASPEGGAA